MAPAVIAECRRQYRHVPAVPGGAPELFLEDVGEVRQEATDAPGDDDAFGAVDHIEHFETPAHRPAEVLQNCDERVVGARGEQPLGLVEVRLAHGRSDARLEA